MNSKSLTDTVARDIEATPAVVESMLEAFAGVLRRSTVSLSSVAVPSFGTWSTVKVDEEIVTDRTTGKRMLLPPQVNIEFKAAAMLRKKINDSHE